MPPERAYDAHIQDPHLLAACAAGAGGGLVPAPQRHVPLDRRRRETFAEIEPPAPSGFGFAVAAHPGRPATAWFVPAVKDECRVPVDGRLVVTRTRDGGASFEALDGGLPAAASWDLVYRHALAVDPGGDALAMGSTTGNLWVERHRRRELAQVDGHLPPIAQVAFRP